MTLINNKTTETIVIEEIPIEPKYWINTPQIDANTEIRWLSSWWWEYYSEVTQGNYSSTATISITSWFTSKYIKITAAENWTPWSTSTAIYDVSTWISKWFNTSYYWSPVVVTHSAFNSNNSILQLREYNTSNDIRARIENISSTWFDINLYEVEYTWYVAMIVECYW